MSKEEDREPRIGVNAFVSKNHISELVEMNFDKQDLFDLIMKLSIELYLDTEYSHDAFVMMMRNELKKRIRAYHNKRMNHQLGRFLYEAEHNKEYDPTGEPEFAEAYSEFFERIHGEDKE